MSTGEANSAGAAASPAAGSNPTAGAEARECPCRSGRLESVCHEPALRRAYEPVDAGSLTYIVPPHFSDDDAGLFAAQLVEHSGYNVEREGPTWRITPKPALPTFLAIPLLRDDVPPARLRVNLVKDAFRGIRYWPPGPYSDESSIRSAQQEFVNSTHSWSVDQFFQIREAFARLIHLPSESALVDALPGLLRTVKTGLPNASVDVVRIHPHGLAAASVVRLLGLMPYMEAAELRALPEMDPKGRGGPFYFFNPEPYFELLANINYPRTSAFGIRFGLEAYVIVDYGDQVTLPPLDASERRARDIGGRVLLAPRTDTIETKAFPRYSIEDRHFLRAWLGQRLNFLFAHLTTLHAAPKDEGGNVLTTQLWKDLLTVEDIVGLTQIVATTSDQAVLRLVFFDLIDRYCQLGGDPERKTNEFLHDAFIVKLAASLGEDLVDLKEPLREWLLDSWTRVSDEVWAGAVRDSERASRKFKVSLPGEDLKELEGSEFVSSWFNAMRNTTHGYHLRGKTFERFLTRHECVLPNAVRELAIALWLCFMASPQHFWPDGKRFSSLRMVDPVKSGH